METVDAQRDAGAALHKTKRASDLTTRSRALQEIQDALELTRRPLRIECFDVSNLQGTDVVASMVVFEDGLARKSEYRRFNIKGVDGQDDVAAMHEVITPPVPPLPRRAGRAGERAGRGPARSGQRRSTRETGRPQKVRVPAEPRGGRRRPPAGRRGRRGRWTSSASTTSRCAGWPSGWRRSGCPARTTR